MFSGVPKNPTVATLEYHCRAITSTKLASTAVVAVVLATTVMAASAATVIAAVAAVIIERYSLIQ